MDSPKPILPPWPLQNPPQFPTPDFDLVNCSPGKFLGVAAELTDCVLNRDRLLVGDFTRGRMLIFNGLHNLEVMIILL
jgi:hypothetical protein